MAQPSSSPTGVSILFMLATSVIFKAAGLWADFLVVGINSEHQVAILKGKRRPLTPQNQRAEIVAALEMVDLVTSFSEPTVEDLLLALRPDVHVNGTDYTRRNCS